MKIDPTKVAGVSQTRRSDKSKKAGSSAFSDLLGETSDTGSARQTSATQNVEHVFAAQEVGDREGSARKARERAEEMLEKLEDIRTGLLLGGIPTDKLKQLALVARQQREEFTDPRLTEILNDIELRALVELAKYDPSS